MTDDKKNRQKWWNRKRTSTSSPWTMISASRVWLVQTDQFLVCDQSSSVGLCIQDYKSLCVAIMICATLVNTPTHRRLLISYTISSATKPTFWKSTSTPTYDMETEMLNENIHSTANKFFSTTTNPHHVLQIDRLWSTDRCRSVVLDELVQRIKLYHPQKVLAVAISQYLEMLNLISKSTCRHHTKLITDSDFSGLCSTTSTFFYHIHNVFHCLDTRAVLWVKVQVTTSQVWVVYHCMGQVSSAFLIGHGLMQEGVPH